MSLSSTASLRPYYMQYNTVFSLNCVFQFFIKFFKQSSFCRSNLLLDIVVCDFKQSVNRFGVVYVLGSTLFSSRYYVRILSDVYIFIASISALF